MTRFRPTATFAALAFALAATGAPNLAAAQTDDADACQGIPCEHMPAPDMCRAWLPDTDPGDQPPPDECDTVIENAPIEADIIFGTPPEE